MLNVMGMSPLTCLPYPLVHRNQHCDQLNTKLSIGGDSLIIIPNTAVFGPTKLIETTTIASTTTWMTVYADEKVYGFLNLDF